MARNGLATGRPRRGMRSQRHRPDRGLDERSLRRPPNRRRAATRRATTPTPINPYGASKLAGSGRPPSAFEDTAGAAAGHRPDGVALRARQARLPDEDPRGGRDVPPPPASASRVVGDEWGCPTYTADVADAIVELLGDGDVRRDPPPGQRATSRRARTGRAPVSRRAADRRRGRSTSPRRPVAAAVDAAALGCPRADAAALRRAAAASGRTRWPTTPRASARPSRGEGAA